MASYSNFVWEYGLKIVVTRKKNHVNVCGGNLPVNIFSNESPYSTS